MEQLVHNLEHGYTIVWYDDTIKGDQLDELKDIAASARTEDAVGPTGKFIVSAWDDAYGDFPSGKHIGISHWGAAGQPHPAVRQGQRRGRPGLHRRVPGQRLPRAERRSSPSAPYARPPPDVRRRSGGRRRRG